VFLGDLDRAQIDASTEDLLTDHWPLVRRLAQVLVERKEISGRRTRQLLFRAQRKELRRARAVAEKDRRNQQTWAAEIRQALGRVA
jgi:hypothetical protein